MSSSLSSGKVLPRRQAVPVLYTRGTHFEVGFDMGRTFSSMIKDFLILSTSLNDCYLPLYNTSKGRELYNETLESVKTSFPQYIRELEGVAEGAEVEFHKLFLLHMDDILPQAAKHKNDIDGDATENLNAKKPEAAIGCSTIICNTKECRAIGHTEDALTETLNHYYFVVAHIINSKPEGKYNIKEEHFMSLCYAGHLPGYTMNYNHHGLVFTINTISAEYLLAGKTPRHFITRALLATENFEQGLTVLKDAGIGAGNACSVNLTYLNDVSQKCYNIEIGPSDVESKKETLLDIKELPLGAHNYHANQFEHLKCAEADQFMIDSSKSRMNTFCGYKAPSSVNDIRAMLGDCTGGLHCVYRENKNTDEMVKTIAIGIFDLNAKTVSLYSDNPIRTESHVTLPLILKECGCQSE